MTPFTAFTARDVPMRPSAVLSGHRHELQWMPKKRRVWRWVVLSLAVGFALLIWSPA